MRLRAHAGEKTVQRKVKEGHPERNAGKVGEDKEGRDPQALVEAGRGSDKSADIEEAQESTWAERAQ